MSLAIFPELISIDPLLVAVKDLPEIAVIEDHKYGIGTVMYNVAFEETWASPFDTKDPGEAYRRLLVREARGTKFDLATRRIISRPYHKFFNIGEKAETLPRMIDFTKPHFIMEKLDGSMLTPLLTADEGILWMTKRGVTSVAATAQEFLDANPNYDTFCRDMIARDLTPIFEWCTRKQRIVLDYGAKDRLVLTGIRENVSGAYMGYEQMKKTGESYDIDVVKVLTYNVTNVDDFIAETRALQDAEGYIVRFEDGSMYKIKGDWYCAIHRTLDGLRFEKDVIRLILNGELDDAKPFLVPTLLGAVTAFEHAIREHITKTASWIHWETVAARDNLNGSKKQFAAMVNTDPKLKQFYGFFFRAWDRGEDGTEHDVFEHLIKEMVEHTSSAGRVESARHIIGGIKWENFLHIEQLDAE